MREHILLLNCDVEVKSDRLDILLRVTDMAPDVATIAPMFVNWGDETLASCMRFPNMKTTLFTIPR